MANVFSLADVYATGEAIKGARKRNAFADMEMAREQKLNALADDPKATPNQYSRLGRSDIGNALLNQEQSKRQAFMQLSTIAGRILQLPPEQHKAAAKQAMQAFGDVFAATGVQQQGDIDAIPDQQLTEALGRIAAMAPQTQGEGFSLPPGGARYDAGGKLIAERAPAPEKPRPRFRPMTPEEVTGAGLPPGTSAQVNDDTGQISVLSKRDATAGLSQKDQTTAKLKLNTVKIARGQLNNIRKRFGAIKGSVSAGAFGQGRIPTEGGRSFDRAVDQMRSTLTALTRVPGVGAMSDYETKLDQAKFPTRQEYESVTEQQIDALDSMLNAIESGYTDILSGGQSSPSQQAATQPTQQGTGPRQITSDAEYDALPSGTEFIAPDGSRRRKP